MPDSPSDNEQWERLAAIFAELLESEDPEAALAGIVDPGLRAEAEKLWRNHQSASEAGFLRETPGVTVLPVFLPGQLLCGRFRVERMLGSGGMGEVYLAADEKVGGRVALKTMARMLAPVESMRHRFLAEVQTARRVTHRNICRIHDWFEDGETAFFTMEYLEGRTLDSFLSERTPSAIEARDWLLGIAEGLGAAHGGGILHGDLKPGNVMITAGPSPRAVVMDFGLARVLEEEAAASGDRNYSLRGGTAEYMAPEVAAGGPPSIASDLFAFGKIAAKLVPEARWWKAFAQASPEARPKTLEPAVRALSPGLTRRYVAIGGLMAASAAAARWWPSDESAAFLQGSLVLVNGIRTEAGMAANARLIRMLFVLALRQSPKLTALLDQDILPVLRVVRADARLPAEGDDLRRLLDDTRASCWVESSLRQSGAGFVWDLSIWRKAGGQRITERSFVQKSPVLMAEAAAVWFRGLAGESKESLRRNTAAVTEFTSKVPEALERYSQALEHIALTSIGRATPLLNDAIRLDPEFAQAHAMLGVCLNAYRWQKEALQELDTAVHLAARLPEQEYAPISAVYYQLAEDQRLMVDEARKSVSLHPTEPRQYRQLAHALCWSGAAEQAVEPSRRLVELGPLEATNWSELVVNLCEANRFDEAMQVVREGASRPIRPAPFAEGLVHLCLENYPEAIRCFTAGSGQPSRVSAGAKLLNGQVESALGDWRQDRIRTIMQGRTVEVYELNEYLAATWSLTDQPGLARQALAQQPELTVCPPSSKRYHAGIFWATRLGDAGGLEAASAGLTAIRKRWPNSHTSAMERAADSARARLNGDLPRAETLILEALGMTFGVLLLADAAEVLEANGNLEAADEYWGRFEKRKGTILKLWYPGYLLYGWRQRMRLARRRGDSAQAVRCAKKIVDHWGKSVAHVAMVGEARSVLAG